MIKFISLLFIFFSFSTTSILAEVAESEPYKIGAILPLTGSASGLGHYLKNGIDLAYGELPQEKQKLIKIVYEDDQLVNTKSVSAYRKLSSVDKVDGVFVLGSGVGNAVGPLAERNKKLMISIGASDKKFAVGTTYVFIHWVVPEAEMKVMIDEIKKRNYQRLALISSEQEGAISVRDAFLDEAKRQGIETRVVLNDSFLTSDRDFKTFITKIRAKKIDGVYVCLLPGSLSTFAKQAQDSGFKGDLFGVELFEDDNEVKASGGALVGKWYVNADEADDQFKNLYIKKYQQHPGWAAANAFDALNIIADAVLKFGKDNLKIADYLRTLKDYEGAAGKYSATGDNRFHLPATIKVVTQSGFEKLYKD